MDRNKSLFNDYIRDLIVEIRCARRDNLPEYANNCAGKLNRIWSTRHNPHIGRYGVPKNA